MPGQSDGVNVFSDTDPNPLTRTSSFQGVCVLGGGGCLLWHGRPSFGTPPFLPHPWPPLTARQANQKLQSKFWGGSVSPGALRTPAPKLGFGWPIVATRQQSRPGARSKPNLFFYLEPLANVGVLGPLRSLLWVRTWAVPQLLGDLWQAPGGLGRVW